MDKHRELCAALSGAPPSVAQAVNKHLQAVTGGEATNLLKFGKYAGLTQEERDKACDDCLEAVRSGDMSTLSGTLSNGAERSDSEAETQTATADDSTTKETPNDGKTMTVVSDISPEPEPESEPEQQQPATEGDHDEEELLSNLQKLLKRKAAPAPGVDPKILDARLDKQREEITKTTERLIKAVEENVAKESQKILDHHAVAQIVSERIRTEHKVLMDSYIDAAGPALVNGDKYKAPDVESVHPEYVQTDNGAILKRVIEYGMSEPNSWFYSTGLTGASGTSKTFPIKNELAAAKKPFYLQSFHEQTAYKDIVGSPELIKSDTGSFTRFRPGSLIRAMKCGCPYVADELDKASPALMAVLHAAIEYGEYLIESTGEMVRAKPGFILFATCNGLGDDTGMYSGHRMDAALVNRINWLKAQYLPAITEEQIFRAKGVDKENAKKIRKFLEDARKNLDLRKISFSPSTRTGTKIAANMHVLGLGFKEATMMACLNTLTPRELKSLNL